MVKNIFNHGCRLFVLLVFIVSCSLIKEDSTKPEQVRVRVVEMFDLVKQNALNEPHEVDYFGIRSLDMKVNGVDYRTDDAGFLDIAFRPGEMIEVVPDSTSGYLPVSIVVDTEVGNIILEHKQSHRFVFALYRNDGHPKASEKWHMPIPGFTFYDDPNQTNVMTKNDASGFWGFDEIPSSGVYVYHPVVEYSNTPYLPRHLNSFAQDYQRTAFVIYLPVTMYPKSRIFQSVKGISDYIAESNILADLTVELNGVSYLTNEDGQIEFEMLINKQPVEIVIRHPDIYTRRYTTLFEELISWNSNEQINLVSKSIDRSDFIFTINEPVEIVFNAPFVTIPVTGTLSTFTYNKSDEFETSGSLNDFFRRIGVNREITYKTVDLTALELNRRDDIVFQFTSPRELRYITRLDEESRRIELSQSDFFNFSTFSENLIGTTTTYTLTGFDNRDNSEIRRDSLNLNFTYNSANASSDAQANISVTVDILNHYTYISTDNGESWSKTSQNSSTIQAELVIRSDNRLYQMGLWDAFENLLPYSVGAYSNSSDLIRYAPHLPYLHSNADGIVQLSKRQIQSGKPSWPGTGDVIYTENSITDSSFIRSFKAEFRYGLNGIHLNRVD